MPSSIVRVSGGRVLGFACMVELSDGKRQIVWSDDVDMATFEFLQDVVDIQSEDRIMEFKTINPRYVVTVQGTHFNITRGPQTLEEVMELEQKDRKQLTGT